MKGTFAANERRSAGVSLETKYLRLRQPVPLEDTTSTAGGSAGWAVGTGSACSSWSCWSSGDPRAGLNSEVYPVRSSVILPPVAF